MMSSSDSDSSSVLYTLGLFLVVFAISVGILLALGFNISDLQKVFQGFFGGGTTEQYETTVQSAEAAVSAANAVKTGKPPETPPQSAPETPGGGKFFALFSGLTGHATAENIGQGATVDCVEEGTRTEIVKNIVKFVYPSSRDYDRNAADKTFYKNYDFSKIPKKTDLDSNAVSSYLDSICKEVSESASQTRNIKSYQVPAARSTYAIPEENSDTLNARICECGSYYVVGKDDEEADQQCKFLIGVELSTALEVANCNDINLHKMDKDLYDCELQIVNLRCTIKNFKMPQDITKAEGWIPYFGDPQFLLYWNTFPHGEDTWNFKIDWKVHALAFVVALIPMSRAGGVGFKTLWAGLRGSKGAIGKLAVEEAEKLYGKAAFNMLVVDAEVMAAEQLGQKATAEGIKKLGQRLVAQTVIKSVGGKKLLAKYALRQSWEAIKSRFKITPGNAISLKAELLLSASGAATVELGALALAESGLKKYEPVGNNIVLKRPYKDPEKFPVLDGVVEDEPVLIKWNPPGVIVDLLFAWNRERSGLEVENFHLVAPCYLKQFDVVYQDVTCKSYTIDTRESPKVTTCLSPTTLVSESGAECTTLDEESINKLYGLGKYEDITKFLQIKDKKLFEYQGFDLKRVYFPHLSTDAELKSNNFFYIDITKMETKESTQIIPGQPGDMPAGMLVYQTITLHYKERGSADDETGTISCVAITSSVIGFQAKDYKAYQSSCSVKTSKSGVILNGNFLLGVECADDTNENCLFTSFELDSQLGGTKYITTYLEDEDSDGNWEAYATSKGPFDMTTNNGESIRFGDVDENGNYKFLERTNCKTKAVVYDLSGNEMPQKEKVSGHNYCLRKESRGEGIAKLGARVVGAAALVVSAFVTGGGSLIAGLVVAGAGAAVEQGVEIYTEYHQLWPR